MYTFESQPHGTPQRWWFIGEQRYFLSDFPATVIVKDCRPWELGIYMGDDDGSDDIDDDGNEYFYDDSYCEKLVA